MPRTGRTFLVSEFCRRSDIERVLPRHRFCFFFFFSFLQTAHAQTLRQRASCSHETFSTCCLEKTRQVRNGGQGKRRRRCVRVSCSKHVEGQGLLGYLCRKYIFKREERFAEISNQRGLQLPSGKVCGCCFLLLNQKETKNARQAFLP